MSKKIIRPATVGAVTAAAALAVFGVAAPASAETPVDRPSSFTSAYTVMATPDQVVNTDGVATPGTPGATGTFNFQVNSDLDIICYDITVSGLGDADYQSPAKTATHLHAAAVGQSGPPRISFPNPTPVGDGPRTSSGCLQGPFTTGLEANGQDTGTGFELSAIEAGPAGFAADTHTTVSVAGAVRGQLVQVPVGGVQTGGGGAAAATGPDAAAIAIGSAAVLGAAALGLVAHRRRSAATID